MPCITDPKRRPPPAIPSFLPLRYPLACRSTASLQLPQPSISATVFLPSTTKRSPIQPADIRDSTPLAPFQDTVVIRSTRNRRPIHEFGAALLPSTRHPRQTTDRSSLVIISISPRDYHRRTRGHRTVFLAARRSCQATSRSLLGNAVGAGIPRELMTLGIEVARAVCKSISGA